MKAESFCYWLQGHFELKQANGDTNLAMTNEEAQMVQRHLNLVFKHDIDPKQGGPEHQAELDSIHHAMKNHKPNVIARC